MSILFLAICVGWAVYCLINSLGNLIVKIRDWFTGLNDYILTSDYTLSRLLHYLDRVESVKSVQVPERITPKRGKRKRK